MASSRRAAVWASMFTVIPGWFALASSWGLINPVISPTKRVAAFPCGFSGLAAAVARAAAIFIHAAAGVLASDMEASPCSAASAALDRRVSKASLRFFGSVKLGFLGALTII